MRFCLVSCVFLMLPTFGLAAEVDVWPGEGALSAAIAKAADGDTFVCGQAPIARIWCWTDL